MASTNFVNGTVVEAAWLNDVDQATYQAASSITGASDRTAVSKFSDYVSVKDFGAVGDGVTDDTAAFNLAIATNKKVFVPYTTGGYVIANVGVVAGMHIEGEKANRELVNTILIVKNTAGAAAFLNSTNTDIFDVTFKNFGVTCQNAEGGNYFYKQTHLDQYSTYFHFENIDSYGTLLITYKGWFIFSKWVDCRDSYHGTAGAQGHYAMSVLPDAFGQSKQTNLNQVVRCQFFNCTSGSPAAVDIAYGTAWHFQDCDFESNACAAARIRGVFGTRFTGCWFEANTAASTIIFADSPAPSAQGNENSAIIGGFLAPIGSPAGQFLNISGATTISIRDLPVIQVPASFVLSNNSYQIYQLENVTVISGAGSAGFLSGQYDGSRIPPYAGSHNMLPIGPGGLGQANFTNDGPTAKSDVASGIGLSGNAVSFTLGASYNNGYYTLPSKLVTYLRGKTITLAISMYAGTANVSDNFQAAVWDSVVPAGGNATSLGTVADSSSTAFQITYVNYTVGAAATALYLGFQAGGANSTKTVIVETMALYMGVVTPIGMTLK